MIDKGPHVSFSKSVFNKTSRGLSCQSGYPARLRVEMENIFIKRGLCSAVPSNL